MAPGPAAPRRAHAPPRRTPQAPFLYRGTAQERLSRGGCGRRSPCWRASAPPSDLGGQWGVWGALAALWGAGCERFGRRSARGSNVRGQPHRGRTSPAARPEAAATRGPARAAPRRPAGRPKSAPPTTHPTHWRRRRRGRACTGCRGPRPPGRAAQGGAAGRGGRGAGQWRGACSPWHAPARAGGTDGDGWARLTRVTRFKLVPRSGGGVVVGCLASWQQRAAARAVGRAGARDRGVGLRKGRGTGQRGPRPGPCGPSGGELGLGVGCCGRAGSGAAARRAGAPARRPSHPRAARERCRGTANVGGRQPQPWATGQDPTRRTP
jgi:hypothetical protein